MSGVAQRSRSDARRAPLTCRAGSGSSGGGGRENPGGTRSCGQHGRFCLASARTRGRIRPYGMNAPQLPVTDPLGSPELWAKGGSW
jgi:hypothetical protein